jgi:hypothetical protein
MIKNVLGDPKRFRELLDYAVGRRYTPVALEIVEILRRDRPTVLFRHTGGELPLAQILAFASLGDRLSE